MTDSNLNWPEGFERTPPDERGPYPNGFQVTRSTAFQNVLDELARWNGVTDVQLDSGAEHQQRNPNKPYANASFDDPGVAVRFNKDGEDMAAACDAWDNPRDNAQDLYRYLYETRMQEENRGTVTGQSEYDKLRLPSGNEAEPGKPSPHLVLGVHPDADDETIRERYRERVKETHPDNDDGDAQMFQWVHEAKEAMLDGGA